MIPSKLEDLGLAAFGPAADSHTIQTPYGSLQLAKPSQQDNHSLNMLGIGGSVGVGGAESEEEEEDDDEDEEDGTSKGKRKRSKSSAGSKNSKKTASKGGAGAAAGLGVAAGERDMHTGRRKIRIEFIEDDSRRHITFSKRKAGIMKKAYELATLTGTQVLLLIVSQTGLVYTFTTPKLSPVVQETAGRELIQSCLNAPEPGDFAINPGTGTDSTEGDQSQGSSEQEEIAIPDFTSGLPSHNNQQSYHDPFADPFHDARNTLISNAANMVNLNLNLPPHLQGMAYGGYPGHHMNATHEQSIPYNSYGV